MGEFIDFLLIAIFVIYIIRSIARLVMPVLFQSVVNKAQQQQQQQNYNQNFNTNQTQGKKYGLTIYLTLKKDQFLIQKVSLSTTKR